MDYLFKNCTSLRNCNVASSQCLILGGASEQLSGLCFQKPSAAQIKLALPSFRARSCLGHEIVADAVMDAPLPYTRARHSEEANRL